MTRTWLTLVTLAVMAALTSACAHDPRGDRGGGPKRCLVNVHVLDDELVVDHEPVRTRACDDAGRRKVTWVVNSVTGGPLYTFAPRAIEFGTPPANLACRADTPTTHSCRWNRGNGETLKYSVRVMRDGREWKTLDPSIINN